MKKQMKLFTNMTKPLVLFVLLFALGVGQMWAGNRRIYFDYSAVTSWTDESAKLRVHCWGGNTGDKDYDMSAVAGESNLIYCDIDDGWTSCCFYRANPSNGEWWNQTANRSDLSTNNRFKIKNEKGTYGDDDKKYLWDDTNGGIRWTPGVAIDGLVDVHNPHTQAFSFTDNDGTYSVTLSAHTTYQFKILDGSTAYGLDNNVWTSSISNYTLNTSGYALRLCTAGSGTYTFSYNKSTHKISVTYPTVSHPNIDYCYMYGYSDWTHKYINIWAEPTIGIEGTQYPGTEMPNYFEIGDDKYYYFSAGSFNKCEPNDNDNGRRTGTLTPSEGYSKYMKHNGSAWVWNTFTVRIQLNDLTPTTSVNPTYMDVAFNSDVLTDLTTVPTKTHYDFGGFYTGYDEENEEVTGVQVINAAGEWIASVDDYTDASKHWIHAGMSTTLYAKWTQHPYDITLAVDPSSSPAGGSIQIGGVTQTSVNAYYVTETAEITAVPSNAAWRFKEWRFSKTGEDYDVHVSPGHDYTSTSNPITIKAEHDGTLTAVFEPRFYLVGVKHSTNAADGGMPGWADVDDYTAPFIVTSTSPLTATCTRALDPNTTFKFLVRNRDNGLSYGYATPGTNIGDESLLMNTADGHVYMDTKGYGDYTFTISAVTLTDGVYYPTVSVSGPTSYKLELKRAYVKVNGVWNKDVDDAGGTVSAETTESGQHFAITNGQYVAQGGSIEYTATPTTPGFTFRGWYNSDYNYRISTENPYTSSNIQAAEHFEAKFTEDTIDVTIANDGHGTVQIGGETVTAAKVGVITTREITAVAHPGYKFSHWTVPDGKNFNVASTTSATTTLSGLGTGSAGTLTANFEPRYELRGSDMNGVDTSVGMPGWTTGTPLTGTTSIEPSGSEDIPVNLTCTCTLHPNKEYKFSIHDRTPNRNYGPSSNLSLLNSGDDMLLNTENNNVKIATVGYGTYIFKITKLSRTNYYPTVTVERQASSQLTLGVNNDSYGSVSAQTNEGDGDGFAITNGQFFATGSDITFTASPNTGYYVAGWYSDAECTTPYNGEDDDVTIGEYNLTLTLSGISTNKTVYAKFAKIWSVYLNSEHTYWSTYAKTDSKDIYTFVLPLPANTQYTFTINDNGAGSAYKIANNYYMDYSNHDNWDGFGTDKTYACGIKTAGKGDYTFTWNATDKKLSVSYPTSYTITFGYGTGGSAVTATVEDATTITTGQYATSGKDITFTQTAATGYTFKGWYDASSGGSAISCMTSDDVFDDIDADTSIYAQYTANTYTVRYNANDASYYGSASGTTASSSHTYDEAKSLTSNGFSFTGYTFDSWNTAVDGSGDSYTDGQSVSNLASTQDATVDLYAIWTANTYTITLNDDHGGLNNGTATATYASSTLTDKTDATFGDWTLLGYWNNRAEKVANADGSLIANITNYTDENGKWIKDGTETLYAHWSRSVTLDDNVSHDHNGAASVTYNSSAGQPTITTVPTRADYAVEGYYTTAACTTKVMEPSGKLLKSVSGYTNADGKWTKTEAATLYAKWIYVIYRTGDSADNAKNTHKSVCHETYAGGTIPTEIEFRMQVSQLDTWYSLCIPFEVNAVKVWDEEDGQYYDIVPYWRTGGTYYTGHYIIRTPERTTDFPIANFGNWNDPSSPTGYKPAKNTPYIIQWHDPYFLNRYVSFFGATGQDIPTSMSATSAPTSDNVVNVCVNDAMTIGSVKGAYMLEPDYGAGGAWLRDENPDADRSVLPFECYIRATDHITRKYRVIRRGMTITDTPTGFPSLTDDPTPVTEKVLINGRIYIIRGGRVYSADGQLVK